MNPSQTYKPIAIATPIQGGQVTVRSLTRDESAYVNGTWPLTKPIPQGVALRATRRQTRRGTVHEMADLGIDYLCGRNAEEPFDWTIKPVTCKRCLAKWRPRSD